MTKKAVIIGAGAAGLTAGYFLSKNGIEVTILEQDNMIGGLSKTVEFDGNYFELGAHRLFTKNEEILNLWKELLPIQGKPCKIDEELNRDCSLFTGDSDPEVNDNTMLVRQRYSRILYERKFFDYPVKMNLTTILNLGILRTMLAGFSYIKAAMFQRKEVTLEDFMINKFGKVLYGMFFEDYTKKVWGRHPRDISKEWGEQRIKGLSLKKVLLNIINKQKEVSLTDYYYYPKYALGQMWNIMADSIKANGGNIFLNSKIVKIEKEGNKISSITDSNGNRYVADYFVSTMPIKELVEVTNDIPKDVFNIASNLEYRDYQLLCLILNDFGLKNNTNYPTVNNVCPDSWIYMQEKDVTFGRLQFMNNWSPYVIKNLKSEYVIGLEFFCSEEEDLWKMSDDKFFELGIGEFVKLGIIKKENIIDKRRYKVKKAYPAYFGTYSQFDKVKDYLNTIPNLYLAGRNGTHKYNNIDHSMLMGKEVANVILKDKTKDILWEVNTEKSYQEAK